MKLQRRMLYKKFDVHSKLVVHPLLFVGTKLVKYGALWHHWRRYFVQPAMQRQKKILDEIIRTIPIPKQTLQQLMPSVYSPAYPPAYLDFKPPQESLQNQVVADKQTRSEREARTLVEIVLDNPHLWP